MRGRSRDDPRPATGPSPGCSTWPPTCADWPPIRRSTAWWSSRAPTRSRSRASPSSCSSTRRSRSWSPARCATPRDPDYDGPAQSARCRPLRRRRWPGRAGVVVVLAGTIEPAADVTKTHASALDTFQSLNDGRLGADRRRGSRPRAAPRPRRPSGLSPARAAAARPDRRGHDRPGRRPDPARSATLEPAGHRRRGNRGRQHRRAGLLAEAAAAIDDGIPVVLASAARRARPGPATPFPAAAQRGCGPARSCAGTLTGPKARIALALALGAGLRRTGSGGRSWSGRRATEVANRPAGAADRVILGGS